MNEVSAAATKPLSQRIAVLIRAAMPEAEAIEIRALEPLFGGNARRATAFELACRLNGRERVQACVMLSAVDGGHVETRLGWEYEVLRRLEGRGVRAPAAVAVDHDGSLIGSPSLVLQRMPGRTSVVEFLAAPADSSSRLLTLDLAEAAAGLHAVDLIAAGFAPPDDPHAVARAQIGYWQDVFEAQRLEPLPLMGWLFGWLHEHLPVPRSISLVHGDLRPGNFLYEGARITALLDWEMAHFGDALEDLAWVYRSMWSPAKFVALDDFVARYEAVRGAKVARSDLLFYRIFSELKFAAISLSAAGNFARGQTLNLRHADRAAKVNECLSRCLHWIESATWKLNDAKTDHG